MLPLASISISTPSRHPANQKGYNPATHSYKKTYVNPPSWTIQLGAFGVMTGEENEKPVIHPSVKSLQWTIIKEGVFEKKISKRRSRVMLHTETNVPEQGEYDITLEVFLNNGSSEVAHRKYLLRDFLIVGIGDSFASGQGNPDVPAVPSPDQKVMCKATSIVMAMNRLNTLIKKFAAELNNNAKEIAKHLPFAGKILVAEINNVENVVGFVKNGISDLKNWTIEIGRKVIAKVGEGIEELFSFFGIGDGADSEDSPHPAAWQEPNAYRSYRSGQSLGARKAESGTASGADLITFLPFGRTGSEIDDGLLGPRTVSQLLTNGNDSIDGWIKNMGQIEEARRTAGKRPIDALIITIGVNDLGFSSLVTNSILKASGEKRKNRIEGAKNKVENIFPKQLNELRVAVEKELKPREVFITEYPVGIFGEIAKGAKPCGILASIVPNPVTFEGLNLDKSDAIGLGEVGQKLNEKIREKAREFGWHLIDGIENGFNGHGYCAGNSFFVSAEESCLNQGDFEGMLHPNQKGHELTRDHISEAIKNVLLTRRSGWLEPVLHMMMR